MPTLTSFPIEFGSSVWIRLVHTRDEMLRGERPAMVHGNNGWHTPFANKWCPVCDRARLKTQPDTDADYFCPKCWAEYTQREFRGMAMYMSYRYAEHTELWLKPGQTFHRTDCPSPSRLPFSYPKKATERGF